MFLLIVVYIGSSHSMDQTMTVLVLTTCIQQSSSLFQEHMLDQGCPTDGLQGVKLQPSGSHLAAAPHIALDAPPYSGFYFVHLPQGQSSAVQHSSEPRGEPRAVRWAGLGVPALACSAVGCLYVACSLGTHGLNWYSPCGVQPWSLRICTILCYTIWVFLFQRPSFLFCFLQAKDKQINFVSLLRTLIKPKIEFYNILSCLSFYIRLSNRFVFLISRCLRRNMAL